MSKNSIYNRFLELYNNISIHRVFKTKLGDRLLVSTINNKTKDISLIYHDFDGSILYILVCSLDNKVEVIYSKIDEMAIYSSLYEIETIIYNKDTKSMIDFQNTLNMLLDGSYTMYR